MKNIMTENVERILARGERLDDLMGKTEDLQAGVSAALGFGGVGAVLLWVSLCENTLVELRTESVSLHNTESAAFFPVPEVNFKLLFGETLFQLLLMNRSSLRKGVSASDVSPLGSSW